MRAGRVLRQIIIARIKDRVPALGRRVYDKAVEGTAYPYATMGPSYWVNESVECIEARAQTVQIDIWDTERNRGIVEDIVDDIAAALHGWADTASLTMSPVYVSLVRVMDDPDPSKLHGVIQVEIVMEG